MHPSIFKTLLFTFIVFFFFNFSAFAQNTYGLKDGREGKPYYSLCKDRIDLIASMPKEVLFGIQVDENGEIYFSMNNKDWFSKIFTSNNDGISVDIVSKDIYSCSKSSLGEDAFPKGVILKPLYLNELKKNLIDLGNGSIAIKLGKVPEALAKKEIEGNLVLINNQAVCYYTFFTDIERSLWDILPMGLFTDTLINTETLADSSKAFNFFTYGRKEQFVIPFEKSKVDYRQEDIKPLYDSLNLAGYRIKKVDIRAYSSVEGPADVNIALQQQRAASIVKAFQKFQLSAIHINISSSENWIEFDKDIESTANADLKNLSRQETKRKLLDKTLASSLEPVLAKERKAIVTVYLDKNNIAVAKDTATIVKQFSEAIAARDTRMATALQKEVVDQILDNKLPASYLNRLEVPHERIFNSILNDQTIYKMMLKLTSESEALDALQRIRQLDSTNGKVNYNICALSFFIWKYDTGFVKPEAFLHQIKQLAKEGIDTSLQKRMYINYHILMSEVYMSRFDYTKKDDALSYISNNYESLKLSDADLLSLAKYFCYYSQLEWGKRLLEKRVDKIDISEDLLFYYVNLMLFEPDEYDSGYFHTAVINAININKKRFCRFFNPIGKGGASFQLLDDDTLKGMYCSYCK